MQTCVPELGYMCVSIRGHFEHPCLLPCLRQASWYLCVSGQLARSLCGLSCHLPHLRESAAITDRHHCCSQLRHTFSGSELMSSRMHGRCFPYRAISLAVLKINYCKLVFTTSYSSLNLSIKQASNRKVKFLIRVLKGSSS